MFGNCLGFLLPLFFLLMLCQGMKAQRVVVVCDMETLTPLRDVVVAITNDKYRDTTDYTGIAHLPVSFGEATFMRYGYIAYTAKQEAIGDTVMLLPSMNSFRDVVVWGKDLRLQSIMGVKSAILKDVLSQPRSQSGASFDFANMLDRRGRRDKKHLEKAKEVLQEWDRK